MPSLRTSEPWLPEWLGGKTTPSPCNASCFALAKAQVDARIPNVTVSLAQDFYRTSYEFLCLRHNAILSLTLTRR